MHASCVGSWGWLQWLASTKYKVLSTLYSLLATPSMRLHPIIATGLVFVTLLLLVAGVACYFRGPPKDTAKIRNVVLISIDTCRADRLGCYGYGYSTTPHIDAVAREGVLFTRAHSTNPITLPAHSSMLTGTYPPYHGVHDNTNYRLGESNVSLAEILHEDGFQTAAFVGAFPLDARFGLDQGFDMYDDQIPEQVGDMFFNERPAEEVSRTAMAWLDEHGEEPFFLFVHYFDPHGQYVPPEPYASRYRDHPYAGEIAYTDNCLGQVIDKLKSLGLYDSTLLVITADHAESLGEHGEQTHAYFIYQSTIHVPLIVKTPGGAQGKQVDQQVSIVDVVPTVLGLLGLLAPPQVQGEDLSRSLFGEDMPEGGRYLYCESLYPTKYGCNPLRGLVHDKWKYIWTVKPELYDLLRDPAEAKNLVSEKPAMARDLKKRLRDILAVQGPDIADSSLKLDGQSAERLKSLGYVGGSAVSTPREVDPNGDDPKDFIDLHRRVMKAWELYYLTQFDEARTACLEILEQRPMNLEASHILGDVAEKEGQYANAVSHYSQYLAAAAKASDPSSQQTAVPLDFDVSRVHTKLGHALRSLGKMDEATGHYSRAVKLDPDSFKAHANLGMALAALGRQEKGRELDKGIHHLRQALRLNSENPQVNYNLGLALLWQDKLEEAMGHLRAASGPNPHGAHAHYQLGVALSRLGRFAESREHLLQACRLDTRNIVAMNNWAWSKGTHPDAKVRDPNAAILFAEIAAEVTDHQNPAVLDTLATAYAAAGHFDRAWSTAEKAMGLASDGDNHELAGAIGERLELYKQSQPYREAPPEPVER